MQSTSFSTWVKSIRVVVGRILRFWDSRNIKKNFEFVGVKPRLMESKIETLTLTLVNLFHLSRKRAVTMTEQVNRLVSPDRGRSKNAALPSTSQVTCSRLDVEGMDLQRTSSRELGNSLQVVIEDLRETATAISEDPPGAKEKPSEGERDKTSRTENTLSEAGEEIAESGEGFPPPSSPWTRDREASLQPVIEETNGVVSMVIPTEVLSDANPLWRCYVVGYFIGDAPHVGSIHATVNRIWANPKNMTKIDVQFIEKNTVFFRIENEQMRGRVLQKKYWHIVDIPLVNQNVVGKLLQELEDLAVQKSTEVGSSSDRLTEKYGEGARSGDSTDPPLNAEGYEEAFVLNRTEQKQWSLVQTGSTYNKVPSETGEGNSNGITVSPSRFNVLAVSEDEGELDDIEEGELVPVLTKTEVPRETKRRVDRSESEKSRYERWERSNRLSLNLMRLTMAESIKPSMPKTEKAREFLEKIKECSQSELADKSIVGSLMNELTTKKFDWSQPIHDHLTHMSNLAAKLTTLGMEVHEQFLVQFIMNSLPLEFSQFQVNYNTIKDKWKFKELKAMLIQEEGRLRKMKDQVANLVGLGSASISKRTSSRKDKRNVKNFVKGPQSQIQGRRSCLWLASQPYENNKNESDQNYSDIVETMAEYSDFHVLEEILHNCFLFLRSFAVAVWVKEPQHACHVIPWDCVP
uniref:DUF4283 domain-containing protein n=1 Tax=Brassica oleracea TaxID=3712 RepID=A0A3P6CPB5_BRAOL|nr:unnamed protein product [Brassica oleracea]